MLKLLDSREGNVLRFPDGARLAARDIGSGVFEVHVTGDMGCKVGQFDSSVFPSLQFHHVEAAVERLNRKMDKAAANNTDSVFVLPSDIVCAMDLEQLLVGPVGKDGREKDTGRDI